MKIKTTSPVLPAILAMVVHAHSGNLIKNGDAEAGSGEGWSPVVNLKNP